jgi:hypothetical protein
MSPIAVSTSLSHALANLKFFFDAETGVQISSDCVVRPLHMLFHRSLHRNQSAQNKTADRGCPRGSLEKDIPYVICVLHKYCAGKCQSAVYPGLLHANHKIFHSCNNRLSDFLLFVWHAFFAIAVTYSDSL